MKTLLILLATAIAATAFPATLRWDKNPIEEGITEYRVYQIVDGNRVLKLTVPATQGPEPKESTPMELQGKEVLVVTAFNGFESEPSDPVTVPVKPSKPGVIEVVEIRVTTNTKDFTTLAYVPLKEPNTPTRFIDARIITVQPNQLP